MFKDPAFLLYTADFLTGTAFMSKEEVGQYIIVLCLLHQHGGCLPLEKLEKAIGKLTNPTLEKLSKNQHGYFSKRLTQEIKKRQSYSNSRRLNRLGKTSKDNTSKTYVKDMSPHMEDRDEDINIDKKKKKKKENITIPPLRTDVVNYCLERKNGVNVDSFLNHYSSKGWMIGKNKMVDWQAAIRTWEQRRKEEGKLIVPKKIEPYVPSPLPDPVERAKVAELIRKTQEKMK